MGFAFRQAAWLPLAVVALVASSSTAWAYTDMTWSGGGSDLSWSTTANWNPQQQPTSADNVFFTEAGGQGGNPQGVPTNSLSSDQTVQNLTFLSTKNLFYNQTTDLGGHTLQVNGTLATVPQYSANGRTYSIQNGTLQVGTLQTPGNIYVSRLTSPGSGGVLDLSNSTVNAVLDSLVVGQSQTGNQGSVGGALRGGNSGTVVIGSQASPGNVYIAYSMGDTDTSASVDLSGQDSLQAHVHNFWIGNSEGNSKAEARVSLAQSNDIHADSIIVGNSGESGYGVYDPTLQLGTSNNIVAPEILIGSGYGQTLVTIPVGGVVNIGSEDVATDLTIGRSDAKIWFQFENRVDFSGAEFNAHLSNLTVGESLTTPDTPQGPNLRATLTGGNQGTITVGSPAAPGTVVVGHVDGTGLTQALVDFSGQTHFIAHLETLDIGVAEEQLDPLVTQAAGGQLKLAQSNLIDVPLIRVGSSLDSGQVGGGLELGHNTVIATDKVLVAVGLGTGTIRAATGSTVVLGDASRRVELQVGIGPREDYNYADGIVDLTGADVTAWLENVTLGYAHDLNTKIFVKGELSLGPLGHVNAQNIMLADGATSWGELNLGGAELIADQITHGAGKVEFAWTAGRLEVGQFGSEQFAFDLPNTGAGTLVTGHVPGNPLQIYGNYQQGAQATLEVHESLGQIDSIVVSGNATLDGTLNLVLPDGFTAGLGEQFTLLTAAAIDGQFAHVKGYYSGGDTVLLPVYQAAAVLLQAFLAGDANLNGTVDGADYTAWADHFMTSADTVAAGDFNGDGFVDGADYIVWADHFAPSVSPSISAVPEPTTFGMCAVGMTCCAIFAMRNRRLHLERIKSSRCGS